MSRIGWRMMRKLGAITVVILLLFAPTCTTADKDQEKQVNSITVEQLYQMRAKQAEYYLLDVRTQEEYQAGHLAGAVLIPYDKLEAVAGDRLPSDGTEIIVYCRTQNRSGVSLEILATLGYKNVVLLDGGFKAWATAGYAFYNMHGELTMKSYGKNEGE